MTEYAMEDDRSQQEASEWQELMWERHERILEALYLLRSEVKDTSNQRQRMHVQDAVDFLAIELGLTDEWRRYLEDHR